MAVRESSDTASAMGISPARAKLLLFSICGGIAGLSGALYALQLGFINPDVGLLDNGSSSSSGCSSAGSPRWSGR